MRRFGLAVFAASLPLLGVGASGCRCDKDERPYTPFGIASSGDAPEAATAPTATSAPTVEEEFRPRRASVLSPPAAQVDLGTRHLTAPEGFLIERYLVLELDAGAERVLAWLTKAERSALDEPAALWRLDPDPAKLASFPPFVPTGPDCKLAVELAQTGPRSVLLDVGAQCPPGGIPRAPTRSVSVHRVDAGERQLVELRLAPALASERLTVNVDSRDRDADGHDDVRISFGLGRETEPKQAPREATVSLQWLDRAAGPAREATEPGYSFVNLASVDVVRSKGPNTSAQALERIENARRLFAYLCEESGTQRVTNSDGTAIRCGDLSSTYGRWVLAEVQAWAAQRRWDQALLALDRAGWYGGSPSSKILAEARQALEGALPARATRRQTLEVRPHAPGPEPRSSPLAFDAGGRLLAQTADGVVRVENGSIQPAEDEVDPWPLVSFSARERRITGFAFPCDEARVSLLARDPSGIVETTLETDLLAPRPGPCRGNAAFHEPELRVVGWSKDAVRAFVGPVEYGPAGAKAPLGSPLSPNGKSRVALSGHGLLVVRDATTERWQTGDAQLSECVVNDGATQVACLGDGGVVLLSVQP